MECSFLHLKLLLRCKVSCHIFCWCDFLPLSGRVSSLKGLREPANSGHAPEPPTAMQGLMPRLYSRAAKSDEAALEAHGCLRMMGQCWRPGPSEVAHMVMFLGHTLMQMTAGFLSAFRIPPLRLPCP